MNSLHWAKWSLVDLIGSVCAVALRYHRCGRSRSQTRSNRQWIPPPHTHNPPPPPQYLWLELSPRKLALQMFECVERRRRKEEPQPFADSNCQRAFDFQKHLRGCVFQRERRGRGVGVTRGCHPCFQVTAALARTPQKRPVCCQR